MARHSEENMAGWNSPIVRSLRPGGWRRHFRNLDLSKRRHNVPRGWVAPVMFIVMGVFACIPAGLA